MVSTFRKKKKRLRAVGRFPFKFDSLLLIAETVGKKKKRKKKKKKLTFFFLVKKRKLQLDFLRDS